MSESRDGSVLVFPGLHDFRIFLLRDQVYRPTDSMRADGPSPFQSVEGLSLGVDVAVRYALDPARLRSVAASLPDNYAAEIVEPAVQGVVYKTFARYTVREIFSSKRAEIQQTMSDLVGIIRKKDEIETALRELEKLRERAEKVSSPGGRAYNPGWHLALDLRNILLIAQCVALAALERQESRGGHTRDDYPDMSPEWRKVNLICSVDADGSVSLKRQPIVPMRTDLLELFDISELKKYMTEEELVGLSGADAAEEKH